MTNTNFDEIISRKHTNAIKYMACDTYSQAGLEPIPLQVADMDIAVPDCIVEALHKVCDRRIYGYTSIHADDRYQSSLQYWMRKRYGLNIEKESVVFGNGTVELIKAAILAYTEPGDGVVIQRPVYGHFTSAIEEECGRVAVNARLKQDNLHYEMDFAALETAFRNPRNKIFLLCSPHNPVGRVWSKKDLQKLVELCRKYDILLISDEVHSDLLRQGIVHTPILALTEKSDKVIQIVAISKTFNCAGLQCGNAVIPNAEIRNNFCKVLGQREPNPFSLEAQVAAYSEAGERWLEELNAYFDETIKQVRDYFAENLPQVQVTAPEGSYILWFNFSSLGLSAEEIHRRIYEEAGVILQDGLVHDPELGGTFQRMCISCPRSTVMEACHRIVNVMTKE